MTAAIEPIPQPPALPLVGNVLDMREGLPKLAQQYGSIFQLELPGHSLVVVSSFELVDELCDERRFNKAIGEALENVRAFAGDGLFTARTEEPNWHKAHDILLPNFSAQAMRAYFPQMLDVATQLVMKWQRQNPDDEVDVPADMTRLTLDTIGLCGFGYRFNSFYREKPHPFVAAMVRALTEAMEQTRRLPAQTALKRKARQQLADDIAAMNQLVDRLIRERQRNPSQGGERDLLDHMLAGVDRQTGERLDIVNVRYQIITFLIAGHETTSGLMSFAIYLLLKNPDVLARAREEVDRVLGKGRSAAPTLQQVRQLQYVPQILKESLRLWPTAPGFTVCPLEPTVIGGRYRLEPGQEVLILLPLLHRDPRIWGDDPERFDPERFLPDAERGRPANAYKPFGNGQRACIGRQFAIQEATLVMAMLLQQFELIDHTDYRLKVQQTLTIKPADFHIKVRARQRP